MLYGAYSLFGCKLVEKKPLDVESNGFFFILDFLRESHSAKNRSVRFPRPSEYSDKSSEYSHSMTSENERFRMS